MHDQGGIQWGLCWPWLKLQVLNRLEHGMHQGTFPVPTWWPQGQKRAVCMLIVLACHRSWVTWLRGTSFKMCTLVGRMFTLNLASPSLLQYFLPISLLTSWKNALFISTIFLGKNLKEFISFRIYPYKIRNHHFKSPYLGEINVWHIRILGR